MVAFLIDEVTVHYADIQRLFLIVSFGSENWKTEDPLKADLAQIVFYHQKASELFEPFLDVVWVILVEQLSDVGLSHLLWVLVVIRAHHAEHFTEVGGVTVARLACFDQLLEDCLALND